MTGIAENEIDMFFGIIGLSIDREPYYTPVIQLFKFEYVSQYEFLFKYITLNWITKYVNVFQFILFPKNVIRSFFFFRTTALIDLWRYEFLNPFALSVWLSISISIILISLLLKFVFFLHEKRYKPQIIDSSSFLIAFGGICNQGLLFVDV